MPCQSFSTQSPKPSLSSAWLRIWVFAMKKELQYGTLYSYSRSFGLRVVPISVKTGNSVTEQQSTIWVHGPKGSEFKCCALASARSCALKVLKCNLPFAGFLIMCSPQKRRLFRVQEEPAKSRRQVTLRREGGTSTRAAGRAGCR